MYALKIIDGLFGAHPCDSGSHEFSSGMSVQFDDVHCVLRGAAQEAKVRTA